MSRRTRVAEGVYRDRYGLAATVKVAGVQREQRFPDGTALERIESWRIQMRASLDEERDTLQRPTARGTLQGDGVKFLKSKTGRTSYKADRAHFRAWLPAFGSRLRSRITREDVEQLVAKWRSADVAARTIRHRLRVLRECYRYLDGPRAKTPVDDVKRPAIPPSHPTAVPVETIRLVARRLKEAGRLKDYARFLVRATTGQRPAQIMRATPADVDLARRIWYVRSAKGGDPVPFPLATPEMVRAWKVFAQADAWGAYDTETEAKVLRRHGWPEGVRPYALRHTFAIDLVLSGADLGDVQGLIGHRQIQTTRSHYAPILMSRLRQAAARRRLKL